MIAVAAVLVLASVAPIPGTLSGAVGALGPRDTPPAARQDFRQIEIDTTEVTQSDVTVSPDDRWLVFTILGHLFRMPVTGGQAEQITFGPYFDSDPAFSPDGQRVAFVSDREDSDRNVFVLDLARRAISQVTREPWADRPIWTPDGGAIVYLSQAGEPRRLEAWPNQLPAFVRRVPLGGGEPESLTSARELIPSAFFLADGRLAVLVVQMPEAGSVRADARVEVLGRDGPSLLRRIDAFPDRVIGAAAGSGSGAGFFCRCYPTYGLVGTTPTTEQILFFPVGQGQKRLVVPLSRTPWLNNNWIFREGLRFAASLDGRSLYVGDAGRVWKIDPADGARTPIPFTARVRLEVRAPIAPPKPNIASPGSSSLPRVILEPAFAPDGQTLVFGAAGYLWQQPLGGGPARRLTDGLGIERDAVFSPNGRRIAYVHTVSGNEEIRVLTLASRESRRVYSGPSTGISWGADGERIVLVEQTGSGNQDQVVAVNADDGRKERLSDGSLTTRPHFSADGQSLFRSGPPNGSLFRLRAPGFKPEAITRLARSIYNTLVSPDEQWLAFRRHSAIWVAPMGDAPIEEKDIRLLTAEGAGGFTFEATGSTLVYSTGTRVYRQRLPDGPREELPVRLTLVPAVPPPVLVRGVRVLDFRAGGFGQPQSVFIERGRITWIGSERGRRIPVEAVIIDGAGRFAIPGLFDLHTHAVSRTSQSRLEALIAHGVTSVRDLGSPVHWGGVAADRAELDATPSPRVFHAGDNLNTFPESNTGALASIHDEAEARRYVRYWKALGTAFIKPYSSLSWKLQRAIADEARRVGLPIAAHGLSVEEITKNVTIGVNSLEHFSRHTRVYDDVLRMMAAAGTQWDPTLDAPWGNDLLFRNQPDRLLDPKLRAFAQEGGLRDARQVVDGPVHHSLLQGLWVGWLASIERGYSLGVKIYAGSDTSGGRRFPGASLHWELEHLVEAKLPPLQVLRLATEHAADAVGARDDLGTIDPGKLADIVLVDEDPLIDIKNTQRIWRVLKGGWVFDPSKLGGSK
jgi:imidazolonepropionase-like amidohydrolase/Tol biopolymer transport system component